MSRPVDNLGRGAENVVSSRRPIRRFIAALVLLAAMVAVVDFARFVHTVTAASPQTDAAADAIVVLTGGADRIRDAAALLGQGRASRLLISGVHPDTTIREIARSAKIDPALLSCCIDVDHLAANTIENAVQAKLWAESRNFGSLIVVTSAYHMPRSMAEFGHVMPAVALVPYPVVRADLGLETWYVRPSTARLVTAEYMKYLVARLRIGFGAPTQTKTRVAGTI